MRIRVDTKTAVWITKARWYGEFADLPEEKRPVVLDIDEIHDRVKIRPKTKRELLAIGKARTSVNKSMVANPRQIDMSGTRLVSEA